MRVGNFELLQSAVESVAHPQFIIAVVDGASRSEHGVVAVNLEKVLRRGEAHHLDRGVRGRFTQNTVALFSTVEAFVVDHRDGCRSLGVDEEYEMGHLALGLVTHLLGVMGSSRDDLLFEDEPLPFLVEELLHRLQCFLQRVGVGLAGELFGGRIAGLRVFVGVHGTLSARVRSTYGAFER